MASITVNISDETLAHVLCIFTIILLLVYVTCISCNTCKYYKYRNNIVLQKRYSHITINSSLLLIVKIIFNCFMYASLLRLNETSLTYTIFLAVDDLLGIIFYYFWVWRFWLIYFDTNWQYSLLNRRWQNQINSSAIKTNNWFLSHRLTFGHSNWIFWHRIAPAIAISAIVICGLPISLAYSEQYGDNEYTWNLIHFLSSISYYVPFILLAIILCKLPEFNDEFFIISELKRIFITFILDNCFHLGVFLIPTLIEHHSQWQNDVDDGYRGDKIIFPFIGFNVLNLLQTIAVLISTKWVISKMYRLNNVYDVTKTNIKIHTRGFSDMDTVQESLSVSVQVLKLHHTQSPLGKDLLEQDVFNFTQGEDDVEGVGLFDILCSEQAFDTFVKHLSSEYSLECLLSLIEFIQFQQYIFQYIERMQENDECSHSLSISESGDVKKKKSSNGIFIFSSNKSNIAECNASSSNSLQNNIPEIISDKEYKDLNKRRFLFKRISFPSNVPRSKIVYDSENVTDNEEFVRLCKLKAFALYRKYIVGGSGLEINVSWSIKRKFLKVMGSTTSKNVFDISSAEQWNISLYGLIKLFDKCCNQMLILMEQSFGRFEKTKQYDKLRKKLFKNKMQRTPF